MNLILEDIGYKNRFVKKNQLDMLILRKTYCFIFSYNETLFINSKLKIGVEIKLKDYGNFEFKLFKLK